MFWLTLKGKEFQLFSDRLAPSAWIRPHTRTRLRVLGLILDPWHVEQQSNTYRPVRWIPITAQTILKPFLNLNGSKPSFARYFRASAFPRLTPYG